MVAQMSHLCGEWADAAADVFQVVLRYLYADILEVPSHLVIGLFDLQLHVMRAQTANCIQRVFLFLQGLVILLCFGAQRSRGPVYTRLILDLEACAACVDLLLCLCFALT